MLKIHNLDLEEANFGKLFTFLKFVVLTRIMSQIKPMTKKRLHKWCLASEKNLPAPNRKILAEVKTVLSFKELLPNSANNMFKIYFQ